MLQLYLVFGLTPVFFATERTFSEYFYHAKLHTPHWFGYFIQRPEHHSIQHQTGVHRFNFRRRDRVFGTFRDTNEFSAQCGFAQAQERNLTGMLALRRAS